MVTWNVTFALGGTQEEEIELFDVATLVDWDPEFKGKYIAGFFETDYYWTKGLKRITRDEVNIPPQNLFMVVGRKWGESDTKGVPLGVLFEFTEGDLQLRGVGPQSIYEKAGGDSNLLLNLVDDLFEKPNLWRTKIIITSKAKSEWKIISEIIGAEPWQLIDQGRKIMKANPKKAIENFDKAYRVFDILTDVNGKFHAIYAQTELALDMQNPDYARKRLDTVWELAVQLGDPMLEENVLSLEGILLYEEQLYEQSIAKFEQALERAKRANIHKAVVNAYCNIGECYYRIENFDKALSHFDKARSLAEERNDKTSLAISQINLAKVLAQYIKRGDGSSGTQARFYLNESLQIFQRDIKDEFGLMLTHGIFGDLEAIEGNLDVALFHYELAAEKAQSLKEHKLHEHYRQFTQVIKDKLYEL
ncbi:MAG: tetratricopeptide repeat protein [Candidatus Hodarchaeota archaeon]